MATVIKSSHDQPASSPRSVQPIAFRLEDMTNQAGRYIEKVRQEAARIIQEAQQQAAAHRNRAEQEGREAAEAAIERVLDEKVAQQMKTLLPALHSATEQIEESRQLWIQHWQTRTVKLAVEIASRIIRREVKMTPEITFDLIREALELAAGSSQIILRLNANDHHNLGTAADKLAAELCGLSPASVVADEEIEPGGCRVDTRFGSIDQQFAAQLDRIEQELS